MIKVAVEGVSVPVLVFARTAVGAAVAITTLSAILPILRLTHTPIKAIILNDLEKKGKKATRLWIGGLILMAAWRNMGFLMVIFLAGLQDIPRDLYEAAR